MERHALDFSFDRGFLFFWRLVWIVVLLCALAFGLLWYLNGDLQGALKQAERSVKIGQQSIDQWEKTGQLPKLNQTDSHQHSEGRWPQASARIYLDPQMDSRFQEAYLEAIQNWNQTGAFNFEIVTESSRADIMATEMNDGGGKSDQSLNGAILVCNSSLESLLFIQSKLWLYL